MTKRKSLKSTAAVVVPTERQMDAALDAFDKSKLRHQIISIGQQVVVRILPDIMLPVTDFAGVKGLPRALGVDDMEIHLAESFSVKYFPDEASARQWREREIIKESVIAALRAKP